MQDSQLLEKDISELIGLSGLEGAERDEMLEQIGQIILESVMIRVMAGFTEEQAADFEAFVATDPIPELMVAKLQSLVPELDTIFEEEVIAFKKECIAVMGRSGTLESIA